MLKQGQRVSLKDGRTARVVEIAYRVKASLQSGKMMMEREHRTPRIQVRLENGENIWLEYEELIEPKKQTGILLLGAVMIVMGILGSFVWVILKH